MKTPYPLSTDYPLLFELIQDGSVIFGMMKYYNQDIPAMIFKKDGYRIDSEFGTFVKEKSTRERFAAMCESVNLRWIVPANLPKECQNCGEKVTMISTGEFCPICKEEQ